MGAGGRERAGAAHRGERPGRRASPVAFGARPTLVAVGGPDRGGQSVSRPYRAPAPHPSGARPPELPPELVPRHVAIIMDGNGRWAKERGLPRTAGHTAGEAAMFDVVQGALEIGVRHLSIYAFSTENWKRSP